MPSKLSLSLSVFSIVIFFLLEETNCQIAQFPGFRPQGNQFFPGNQGNRPGNQRNRPGNQGSQLGNQGFVGNQGVPGNKQNFWPPSLPSIIPGAHYIDRFRNALNNLNSEFHDILHPPSKNISTGHLQEFRYTGPLGVENWVKMFPRCGGTKQSPISINQKEAKVKKFEPLIFKGYENHPRTATITNNGHTGMVTLPEGKTIKGGGLPGEFEFLNMHFHWGFDSTRGSEHNIDNVQYPLELHLVHWNYKYFSSEEALFQPDGIAVLGVLFHVEPTDNPFLEPIMEALASVKNNGATTIFKPNFSLFAFLPKNKNDFFRYDGSLTTPACRESVIWTVFANTLAISERQLDAFRSLLNPENKSRKDNHRPVQPLNSRIVYRSQ